MALKNWKEHHAANVWSDSADKWVPAHWDGPTLVVRTINPLVARMKLARLTWNDWTALDIDERAEICKSLPRGSVHTFQGNRILFEGSGWHVTRLSQADALRRYHTWELADKYGNERIVHHG